jgi:biotin carboxyl carrier protein
LPALLRDLADSGVTELEVVAGEASLFVRQRTGPARPAPAAGPEPGTTAEAGPAEGLVAVTTPLAGIAYRSPSPDEPAYVRVGEAVRRGQVVALIEAMKVFNEIHADVGGVVEEILVTSGQSVQAGQTLLLVRPDQAERTAGDGAAGPPSGL